MASIWVGARGSTKTLEELRQFAIRCSCGIRDFNFEAGGYILMDVPLSDELWYRQTLLAEGCNLGRQGLTIGGTGAGKPQEQADVAARFETDPDVRLFVHCRG